MPNWRVIFPLIATVIGAVASGCTASFPPGGTDLSWPPRGGRPTLHVVVPQDATLPADFVIATETQTGVRIVQTPTSREIVDQLLAGGAEMNGEASHLAEQVEAVMGVDSESATTLPEGAAKYGEDDLCSLLDLSWYSANNLGVPESYVEDSQGIQEGSVFLTARQQGVAGADSRWELLPGTCSPVGVYLVPLGAHRTDLHVQERTSALLDYLLSPQGQEAIGTHGLAFPIGTRAGQSVEVISTSGREIKLERPAN